MFPVSSGLAAGAVVTGPLADDTSPDRRAASITRQVFAVVDHQFLLEIAGFAARTGKIPQRGAAAFDRQGQYRRTASTRRP